MGLESVIYSMATDSSFARSVSADPKASMRKAKFNLSADEFVALDSVLAKLGATDLFSLSITQITEWLARPLATWV